MILGTGTPRLGSRVGRPESDDERPWRSRQQPASGPVDAWALPWRQGAPVTRVCMICGREESAPFPYRTCARCDQMTRDDLYSLPRLAETLRGVLVAPQTGDDGCHSSGTTHPPLPLQVHILSLLGPDQPRARRFMAYGSGSLSILAVLGGWARRVYDFRRSLDLETRQPATPSRDVGDAVSWIGDYHFWMMTEYDGYSKFADDIRKTSSSCRKAMEADKRVIVGRCPTVMDEGKTCNVLLYVTAGAEEIKCTACRSSWQKWRWPWLGEKMTETKRGKQ